MKVEILEPVEGGRVVYQLIGPPKDGASGQARVSVMLRVTNDGKASTKIDDIRVLGESLKAFGLPATLNPGQSLVLQNYRDDELKRRAIVLNEPFPAQLTVAVLTGTKTVATATMPMKAHLNDGGALSWPGHCEDLGPNEFWVASSDHASDHQVFALDTAVSGWKGTEWSENYRGTPNWSPNREHYRVYGLPIYAMADGVVVAAINDHEERPTTAHVETKSPSLGKFNGAGNVVVIRSGSEVAGYCHLQRGSIPEELTKPGAPVRRGQYLGKVGLSGSGSHPHLHIDVKKAPQTKSVTIETAGSGPFRPMSFSGGQVLSTDEAHGAAMVGTIPKERWTPLHNQSFPHVSSLMYPATSPPPFAAGEQDTSRFLSVWRASGDIELRIRARGWEAFTGRWDALSKDQFRLTRVATAKVAGTRVFYGIFRRGTFGHALWSALGWEAFTQKWKELSDSGQRLVDLTTFPRAGDRQYVGVFHAGNDGHALISVTGWKAFQDEYNKHTPHGLRLVDVETFPLGGNARQYVGVFRGVGGLHKLVSVTGWNAFTTRWGQETDTGLRLSAVESFAVGGQREYVAVFAPGNEGHALHEIGGWEAFRIACEELNGKGLRMVDVHVTQ